MELHIRPIQPLRNQNSEAGRSSGKPANAPFEFASLLRVDNDEKKRNPSRQRRDSFTRQGDSGEEVPTYEQTHVVRPPVQTVDESALRMLMSQRV